MTDTDHLIDQSIAAEERDLLRRIGDDPGHLEQAVALFSGRGGWVARLLIIAQTVMFMAGAWASWNFFGSKDALTALHWGLPAAVLLLMALMIKLALWPVMQTHRILVAIKRLELLSGHDGPLGR